MTALTGPYIEEHLEPDTPIYRVLPQKYLEELLDGTMVLMATASWPDRYENLIQWCHFNAIQEGRIVQFGADTRLPTYAQCWSRLKDSDAIWRIYSAFDYKDPMDKFFCDGEGVLLRSTPRKLINALARGVGERKRNNCFIFPVKYFDEEPLRKYVSERARAELKNAFGGPAGHADALSLKRSAFEHEQEVRLLYVDTFREEPDKMLKIPVDVNAVVDEITLDPRITGGEYNRRQWILDRGFRNPVHKSNLNLGILLEIVLFTQEELRALTRTRNGDENEVNAEAEKPRDGHKEAAK